MSKSVRRVEAAARDAGLVIEVRRMPATTRTAADAAAACGCGVGQIVKSLIFAKPEKGDLVLLLVSGANQVDTERTSEQIGATIDRADAGLVRERTGFAIGGVAPIGHLAPIETWIDEDLLQYPTVWAAAGAPDAVFEIEPARLRDAAGAKPFKPAGDS